MTLLERAAALVPAGEIDVGLEAELVDALFWTGKFAEASHRARANVDEPPLRATASASFARASKRY